MLKAFRDFAIRGSFADLAIVVLTGAAFGAIVSSLVDDAFVPIIGRVLGQVDLSNLFIVVSNPNSVAVSSLVAGDAALNIGLFINAVVEFTIVAFVLFLVVKGINTVRNRQAAAPPAQHHI